MSVQATIGVYRPGAVGESGKRICGWDEDSTTLAVEALRLCVADVDAVRSVTVVSPSPTYLVDDAAVVIAAALRLPDPTPVISVHGGAAAALLAVTSARVGDAVVAVDADGTAGAAAIFVRSDGALPVVVKRVRHSLPYRTRRSDSAEIAIYDDPRLVRERAWRPAIALLAADVPTWLTGVPAAAASRLGQRSPEAVDGDPNACWAAIVALADAAKLGGRVVALDGASGLAVDVPACGIELIRDDRPTYPAISRLPGERIAISLAAYDRAFDAKVGLKAARCSCGVLSFPPRRFCPECGNNETFETEDLPYSGSVYSVVTVRTPLPGLPREYSLAVVDITGTNVRVLAHVTSTQVGTVQIDDAGRLVLRKIAERQGIPDYGFGFAKDAA